MPRVSSASQTDSFLPRNDSSMLFMKDVNESHKKLKWTKANHFFELRPENYFLILKLKDPTIILVPPRPSGFVSSLIHCNSGSRQDI